MTESTEKSDQKQNKPWLFQPGQSGNPAGKPKGIRHMSTLLEEAIKKVAEDTGTPEDIAIIKTVIDRAKKGDMKAIEHIWDRLEGKAPQSIDITTDGEKLPAAGDVDVEALAIEMAKKLKEQKA